MRVQGQVLSRDFTRVVSLTRPDGSSLELTLRPLPLGFQRRLRACGIVPPQPPSRVARDAGGQPLRDAAGQVLTLRDEADAAYLTAVELYHQRVAVLSVAEALRADPTVEFEAAAPRDSNGAWPEYADALFVEMEQAGITAGDLVQLCTAVCRLSRLIDDDLRGVRANFSSTVQASTA